MLAFFLFSQLAATRAIGNTYKRKMYDPKV
jgi:hypothetical protein